MAGRPLGRYTGSESENTGPVITLTFMSSAQAFFMTYSSSASQIGALKSCTWGQALGAWKVSASPRVDLTSSLLRWMDGGQDALPLRAC